MKRILLGLFLGAVGSSMAAVTISNVSAQQREGTKLVDIRYDVISDVTNIVNVAVRLSDGITDVAAYTFTGDIGEDVQTGAGKLIVWNAGTDQSNIAATVQVHLIVDDGASDPNVFVPPCPVPQTGQTNTVLLGDDGGLQTGVAWPEPRYFRQPTPDGEVFIDYMSGLMWQIAIQDDGYGSKQLGMLHASWEDALNQCAGSSYGGYSDWRLPSVKEVLTLRNCGGSTSFEDELGVDWVLELTTSITSPFVTNDCYVCAPSIGDVFIFPKNEPGYYLAVRTVQANSPAPVPASGQEVTYYIGDYGDHQSGTPWPSPRFIENGLTVTDRLTGLEWVKNPGVFGKQDFSTAVTFSQDLVYAGHSDWRLPNVNEMESLIDRSQFAPALPAEHSFSNVPSGFFWTSSSFGPHPESYSISLNNGIVSPGWHRFATEPITRSVPCYLWPTRGGE